MRESLRPLSLSELLDRAIQLYRKHFGLFVGIAAIPLAAVTALQVLEATLGLTVKPGTTPAAVLAGLPRALESIAILEFLVSLAFAYALGATVLAVGHLQLGETASISRSFQEMKGRLSRVALTMIAAGIAGLVPWLVVLALGAMGWIAAGPSAVYTWVLVLYLAAVAAAVASIWIWSRLAVAVPAVAAEDLGVFAALRRSAALAKGSVWRVFLVFLLTYVLEWALDGLLAVPALIIAGLHHPATGAWQGWTLGARFLIGVLAMPVQAIGFSLLFYDFKVRKEAFDFEVLLRRDAAGAQVRAR